MIANEKKKGVEGFPDKVPGLSPSQEVDFAIDLVLRADTMSMTHYIMALAEFAELKKQRKVFLEKKFIQSSVSPWGAIVLPL